MFRQVNGYVKFLDKKIPQDIKKYYDIYITILI